MQIQAVNNSLRQLKVHYLQQIREWQASLKSYDEAVKLDMLRLSLLKDLGSTNAGSPQVCRFDVACSYP
jgi:hypothetical protein